MNPDTFTAQDGFNIAIICLPLAALIFGIGVGVVATKFGYFIVFREHLDEHFFASTPDRDCPFCHEERGSFAKGLPQ